MSKFHRFVNPIEVETWVREHYTEEQLDSLTVTKNLDSPLAYYKGSCYQNMNLMIRSGIVGDRSGFGIPTLQSLLMSFTIPSNIIVYRFVDLREFAILHYKTLFGRTYVNPMFLSATLLKDQYSMSEIRKHRIAIKIFVNQGARGAYLPEVNPHLPEYEILFPYHTSFIKRGIMEFEISAD